MAGKLRLGMVGGWLTAALLLWALAATPVISASEEERSDVSISGGRDRDALQDITGNPDPSAYVSIEGDLLGGFADDERIRARVTLPRGSSLSGLDAGGIVEVTRDPEGVIVEARVGDLRDLVEDGSLLSAEHVFEPDPKAISEALPIMEVPSWHAAGLRGQGVKIGVFDTGFAGYTALLGTDLPTTVTTRSFSAFGIERNGSNEPSKHGTAVAEIIHDIAPRAQLVLVNLDDLRDWDDAVDYFIAQDVDVVNASLGTELGPMDESTPLSAATQRAIDAGITWVNSAGNEAQKHWGGPGLNNDGDRWLGINGDELAHFEIYNDANVQSRLHSLNLSWVNGTTATNLWLCIFRWTGSEWVTHAINGDATDNHCAKTNSMSDRPRTRLARVTNTSGSPTFYAYGIFLASGSLPQRVDVFHPDRYEPLEELEHSNPATSLSEPGLMRDVISVGAYPACNVTRIEPYSSRGPSVAGYTKPDVLGAALVSTEAYGPYQPGKPCDYLEQNAFSGTSSASPHVAGLAALHIQVNPAARPSAVRAALEAMAKEGSYGRSSKSNTYGWGIAQLPDPASVVDRDPPTWPNNALEVLGLAERRVTLRWKAARDETAVDEYLVVQAPGTPTNGVYRGNVIARLPASTRAHTVTGLAPDTRYAFWVEASDKAGNISDDGPLVVIQTAVDFADTNTSVFHDDIMWLSVTGITQGCNPPANDQFCPEAAVTRGQMASFLVRALALVGGENSDYFLDDGSSIHERDVDRLAFWEITQGCNPGDIPPNTRFCPDSPVTRAQMASFLTRALLLSDGWGTDYFTDDDASVHEFDINRLAFAGITRGCNPPINSIYCPADAVSRGEMAAFLHRAVDRLNEVRQSGVLLPASDSIADDTDPIDRMIVSDT